MKQKEKRRRIAAKRHEQKAARDKQNGKDIAKTPIELTRTDIVSNIALFEKLAESDRLYIAEDTDKLDNAASYLILGILIAVTAGFFSIFKGTGIVSFSFITVGLSIILTSLIRRYWSRDSINRWTAKLELHLEFVQEWQEILKKHDSGERFCIAR